MLDAPAPIQKATNPALTSVVISIGLETVRLRISVLTRLRHL